MDGARTPGRTKCKERCDAGQNSRYEILERGGCAPNFESGARAVACGMSHPSGLLTQLVPCLLYTSPSPRD
eukprot:1772415-Alexandrium_andersonii.AAC.1